MGLLQPDDLGLVYLYRHDWAIFCAPLSLYPAAAHDLDLRDARVGGRAGGRTRGTFGQRRRAVGGTGESDVTQSAAETEVDRMTVGTATLRLYGLLAEFQDEEALLPA